MTSDEFFYVWLFYGSGKTHNWCYGRSTEAEGKLSISRPFVEYPEKLARLACGSRLSRSLAHCLARGFSKQGLKCPCADCKYRSSRRVCARKRNLTTVYDITKICLDRRKEEFGEIFVTDFLCNQSILLSVPSKAFSCW